MNKEAMPTESIQEWRRGQYSISTDRTRLQLDVIHRFLSEESYWASGRSRERVRRAIDHSVPFGLYDGERQVGFARVVTDYVVVAYLADVFVLDEYRGQGLGEWLVGVVTGHPDFATVRRWVLATRDAHGLYRKFGFADPVAGRWMERLNTQH
jgi:GNAT superfamily N-acetyltransferase